jgi:hypothetical protein
MISGEEANHTIEGLVASFEEQFEDYKGSDYNEPLTRHDFPDPFSKRRRATWIIFRVLQKHPGS